VTQFRTGDKVMSRHTLGACAELGNAKAALCDLVPAGMNMEAAGVFRGAYGTAYHALLQRGRLNVGEWVLVHGAAGGIGIAAIQVAKLFGAKVIATASTEEKRSACLEEGADHAIDYQGGFIDRVKELTGGRGVDIAYDPIGAQVTDDSLRCLAWCGRLLILGFLGGGPTNIRSNYLLIKGIDAIGVRIGGLNEADPELAIANMKALTEFAALGKLKPRISHRFPLARAADAMRAVIDRKVIGKAVLAG
jgi:NADPH2:quinone reductase